ncbi:MAG: N-acetylmuramic acid 6-phosphate etherase [Capsulimonadaceae bacterium]|nr:N-acetylmuramic acid 6-phosphate etherase [Capsulimonadaceae bacterium]
MDYTRTLDRLVTETINPDLSGLDTLPTVSILQIMNAEDDNVAPAVALEIPNISRAVRKIVCSFRNQGRLIYVGAGTSGRLGVLDASECPPTFGSPPQLIQAIIAGGDTALRRSIEGAEDDVEAGAIAIAEHDVNDNDTVVGISASGRTPYVCGALAKARQRGASTVAVVNNRPSEMEKIAAITIAPIVGPEVLAGSTRLKAGTAQKMVLNMLTTCAMIETGKTYGNLMVDVRATNVKLVARAKRIVRQVTGAMPDVIEKALDEAGGNAKVAIVMVSRNITASAAEERLTACGGFLRKALGVG